MRDLKLMDVLTQKGPACGTTSLAMVIRFLTQYKTITSEDIDREIRKIPWMFSAPTDLINYARGKGLQAEEYNNGSLQQLEDFISCGIPTIALLDLTPDNAFDMNNWHYVVVVAIERTDNRCEIIINNPWGRQESWEQDRFIKEWARLKLLGLTFGYNNYFIGVGTAEDSLPIRRTQGVGAANNVTKGLADVLNGFAGVWQNHNFLCVGRILVGIYKLTYGAFYMIINNFISRIR